MKPCGLGEKMFAIHNLVVVVVVVFLSAATTLAQNHQGNGTQSRQCRVDHINMSE